MAIPNEVLEAFSFGSVQEMKPISIGLIHATFFVKTGQGKYIIQRLHPALATDGIARDFLHVTQFLHAQKFLAPQCMAARDGRVLVEDKEGRRWRAQAFVHGKTYTHVTRPALAWQAGRIFAKFHRVMEAFPHPFETKKVLHDTEFILKTFQETLNAFKNAPEMDEAGEDAAFLLKELPMLLLPRDLPVRVIHGDPKISNILFNAKGEAKALVDLDTCNRRSVLVELGDAFRSWCGVREDHPKNRFRMEMFEAGWRGYQREADSWITKSEISLIPQAVGLITLELAARFLTDYFVDAYFGWDASRYPSRRAHNLARARGQMALYCDTIKNRLSIEHALKK